VKIMALTRVLLLTGLLVLVSQPNVSTAQEAQLRDLCTAQSSSTVLTPQPQNAKLAKTRAAVLLDERYLQWPGQDSGAARYVLAYSPDSTIEVTATGVLQGGAAVVEIEPHIAELSAALKAQFAWLDKGIVLSLGNQLVVKQWRENGLQGQMVVAALDKNDQVLAATELQTAAALDSIYRAADDPKSNPLGVHLGPRKTTISVWAPTANQVYTCVYVAQKTGDARAELHSMTRSQTTGSWSLTLPHDLTGSYYTFLVDVHVTGVGRVVNRVTDPYSISLNANSQRSYIADLNAENLQPPGWSKLNFSKPLSHPGDMVVYELHVRDFSWADATVRKPWRGKYLAFTQKQSAGMQHLKSLARAGITDLHLLPVFDLATVPEKDCVLPAIDLSAIANDPASEQPQSAVTAQKEIDCFNWGYDPLHYGAPEGSFATDSADGAVRIRELRSMVLALKSVGLRVGMDLVYNHTSAAGQAVNSVLDKIVPGYYQRFNSLGDIETSTCCANTATEHRMMARLMHDTVVRWVEHFGMESFRFDLMGHQPRDTMVALYKKLNQRGQRVFFIGEGWNFGEVANNKRFVQAAQGELNGTGIGTFSDRARDAIRGGGCCDSGKEAVERKGFVNFTQWDSERQEALRLADLVRLGLAGTLKQVSFSAAAGKTITGEQLDYAGQKAGYATDPMDVVNYVENHDNQTLFDINVFKLPRDTTSIDRARVQVLALAVPALSFGVSYFHAGGELLRSKSLDRNSYDSGDWFNRIDWAGKSNGFPSGLPIKNDNGNDWELMRAFLRDQRIRVSAREIAWTKAQFLQLLAVRKSLMPVGTGTRAAQRAIQELTFLNTGPDSIAGLVVARLFDPSIKRWVVYALNARQTSVAINIRGQLTVHPAIRRPWYLASSQNRITIPARSWAIWAESK
jgi:pullulanase